MKPEQPKPEQDLEQLKELWNTQEDEAMFAVNQAALDKKIQTQVTIADRCVKFFEWVSILILSAMAIAMFIVPLIQGNERHQWISGSLYLLAIAFLVARLRRRKRRLKDFDNTVVGDLDRAIFKMDYLIQQYRSAVWWFVLPVVLGMCITSFSMNSGRAIWIWPWVTLSMIYAFWEGRRTINKRLRPKKAELEELRRALAEEL